MSFAQPAPTSAQTFWQLYIDGSMNHSEPRSLRLLLISLLGLGISASAWAQAQHVFVLQDSAGFRLQVAGKPFFIQGMNWDYFPIGTTYTYSLWEQPDEVIRAALKTEMSLLTALGVNAIRQYTKIPPRWIEYIYQEYGIYTLLNHSFGRYGLTLDGTWVANTDYADPQTRELLLAEVQAMVEEFRATPGLLMYLLGNENNYGLFWEGAETEDIPAEGPDGASTTRARAMYRLFDEASQAVKTLDPAHPVAICNGDLQFLDLIVAECPNVDVLGINIYRGASFGDAFDRVKQELDKPLVLTEFGGDAFNALTQQEDQKAQARYALENWREIYANAAGMGQAENCLGGFTFQFSDGWWKHGQTTGLEVHDVHASWANGGYEEDFRAGTNNMNEEWFGICAKGPANERGHYPLHPRAAYFVLQQAHQWDPYAREASLQGLQAHFDAISLSVAYQQAQKESPPTPRR